MNDELPRGATAHGSPTRAGEHALAQCSRQQAKLGERRSHPCPRGVTHVPVDVSAATAGTWPGPASRPARRIAGGVVGRRCSCAGLPVRLVPAGLVPVPRQVRSPIGGRGGPQRRGRDSSCWQQDVFVVGGTARRRRCSAASGMTHEEHRGGISGRARGRFCRRAPCRGSRGCGRSCRVRRCEASCGSRREQIRSTVR
jgi:hypothetical protein